MQIFSIIKYWERLAAWMYIQMRRGDQKARECLWYQRPLLGHDDEIWRHRRNRDSCRTKQCPNHTTAPWHANASVFDIFGNPRHDRWEITGDLSVLCKWVICTRLEPLKLSRHGHPIQRAIYFHLRRALTDFSCCRILASIPFRFLVGRDKTLVTVHTALVAHHSKLLGTLVNGPMLKAKEGCAWLEDVDECTMVRFGQYANTGDYAAAEPDILIDASNIPAENSAPSDDPQKGVAHGKDAACASSAVESEVAAPAMPVEEQGPEQAMLFSGSRYSDKKKNRAKLSRVTTGDVQSKRRNCPKPSCQPRLSYGQENPYCGLI